jgi:hypothetical protein
MIIPFAPLYYEVVIVLNLSCPAVSHICNFTILLSSLIVFILKSTPIVLKKFSVKLFSEYRRSKHDFPTPLFPINNNFIK